MENKNSTYEFPKDVQNIYEMEERAFRKEMEMLGIMVWMLYEPDLIKEAVENTGWAIRKQLRILAGLEKINEDNNT